MEKGPLHRGSQLGETDTVTDDAPERDDSEINQTKTDKVMRRNLRRSLRSLRSFAGSKN